MVYPSTHIGVANSRYCNAVLIKITSTRGLCINLTVTSCSPNSRLQIYDGDESSRVLYSSHCRPAMSFLSSSAVVTAVVTLRHGVWLVTPLFDLRYQQQGTFIISITPCRKYVQVLI